MAATGLQTTKGLYFTFTLLCLVCLTQQSLMTKDELVHKLLLSIENNEILIVRCFYLQCSI